MLVSLRVSPQVACVVSRPRICPRWFLRKSAILCCCFSLWLIYIGVLTIGTESAQQLQSSASQSTLRRPTASPDSYYVRNTPISLENGNASNADMMLLIPIHAGKSSSDSLSYNGSSMRGNIHTQRSSAKNLDADVSLRNRTSCSQQSQMNLCRTEFPPDNQSVAVTPTPSTLSKKPDSSINELTSPKSTVKIEDTTVPVESYPPTTAFPIPSLQDERHKYIVLKDYIPAERTFLRNDSVTLTTHATFELLYHVGPLSERWQGPVSVAVYAPGTDFQTSVRYIFWLRKCYSGAPCASQDSVPWCAGNELSNSSSLTTAKSTAAKPSLADYIRQFVSFHLVFHRDYRPEVSDFRLLRVDLDRSVRCEKPFVLPLSYRHKNLLEYPINVCRNVARLAAKTHYILASDIELYPSSGIIPRFLYFIKKKEMAWENAHKSSRPTDSGFLASLSALLGNPRPHRTVYVLPIFEVDKDVHPPLIKRQLVDLYRREKAVFFHKYVCALCNIIPRINKWLQMKTPTSGTGPLGVFMTVKRHRPFNRWEPIYIGTNAEPLYDERLSWEGQQDKMSQMYELCLLDYNLAVLDNAFLVHAPGIKRRNTSEQAKRARHIGRNSRVYRAILLELHKKYGYNPQCR